jgi:thioredoxin-related protein
MIKQIVKIGTPGIIIFLIILVILKAEKNKNEERKPNRELPDVKLSIIGGDSLSLKKSIQDNQHTVISFLSVECRHCEFQAMDIKAKESLFTPWNHIIVIESHDSAALFINRIGFSNQANYKLTTAKPRTIHQFNIRGMPSTLLCNSTGKILKEIPGELKVEKTVHSIEKCLKNK